MYTYYVFVSGTGKDIYKKKVSKIEKKNTQPM